VKKYQFWKNNHFLGLFTWLTNQNAQTLPYSQVYTYLIPSKFPVLFWIGGLWPIDEFFVSRFPILQWYCETWSNTKCLTKFHQEMFSFKKDMDSLLRSPPVDLYAQTQSLSSSDCNLSWKFQLSAFDLTWKLKYDSFRKK